MWRVYMFCLFEMKDGVNQRTFFGNEAWGRFKMMRRWTRDAAFPWRIRSADGRCVFLYHNWSPPWGEVERIINNVCVSVDMEEGCSVNSDWNVWRPLASKFRCVAERYFSHVNTLIHVSLGYVLGLQTCSPLPGFIWTKQNPEFHLKIAVFPPPKIVFSSHHPDWW